MNDAFYSPYATEFLDLLAFVLYMGFISVLTHSLLMLKIHQKTEKGMYVGAHFLAVIASVFILATQQPFVEKYILLVIYSMVACTPFHQWELGKRAKTTLQYVVACVLAALNVRVFFVMPTEDVEYILLLLYLFLLLSIVAMAVGSASDNQK